MEISTDRARLARHIAMPAEIETVRWLASPRGTVGLGPTDLALVAQFPLSPAAWKTLRPRLKAVTESQLRVPASLSSLVKGPLVGEVFTATPFESIRWQGHAVWGEGLLTLVLFSR